MPPPHALWTPCFLITGVFAFLSGCDLSSPVHQIGNPEIAPRGPSISSFPEGSIFRAEDYDAFLASHSSDVSITSGDSLIIVPLVFDQTDSLYSAVGFNQMMAAAGVGTTAFSEDDLYFTDYDTFVAVIGGLDHKNSPSSYQALYADGSHHSVPSGAIEIGSARRAAPYQSLFDPYECGEMIECPAGGGGSGGSGGGSGGSTQPYRPASDQAVSRSAQPTWPSIWVGDVVSGEKDCGSSGYSSGCSSSSGGGSSTFSNLGHSLIITELNNSQQWGGNYLNDFTLSMEAIGDVPGDPGAEVVERAAKTWFDVPNLEYAMVLYHRFATWPEREAAVAFARSQDPDPYAVMTTKTNENEWYCSKLVWRAYRVTTGDDLDPNWGFWVMPADLERSGHLITVYHYENE